MAKVTNSVKMSKPVMIVGFAVWSVIVFALAYNIGSTHQINLYTARNKPLTAPKASKETNIDFVKASSLAQAKQYDQAIAVLTPQVAKTSYPTDQRIQGMVVIAEYYQAKTDPETSLKWYLAANTLAGSPRIRPTLGAASASAQLYALKSTGPEGPKGAESYKTAAINYYTQALTLTTDASLKTQIESQISALNKVA